MTILTQASDNERHRFWVRVVREINRGVLTKLTPMYVALTNLRVRIIGLGTTILEIGTR